MLLNRFAVSMLSRRHKAEALPQEVMIHKETGQISIKTNTGDVISYDSLARLNQHIDHVTLMSYNLNIYGEMFSLQLDGVELPEVIGTYSPIMNTPIMIKPNNVRKMLVSIDMDSLVLTDSDTLVEYEPTISIDVKFKNGAFEQVFTITKPISELNGMIITPFDYYSADTALLYQVSIEAINITKDARNGDLPIRNILHSILIVVE